MRLAKFARQVPSSHPSCSLQPSEYGKAASTELRMILDSTPGSYEADDTVSIGDVTKLVDGNVWDYMTPHWMPQ